MSNGKVILAVVAALLLGVAITFLTDRGYGKVSPDAYEVSKALYGACLAKSDARLDAVEALFDDDSDQAVELNDKERRWLESMIATAKEGNWESAATSARRMMEDQVE